MNFEIFFVFFFELLLPRSKTKEENSRVPTKLNKRKSEIMSNHHQPAKRIDESLKNYLKKITKKIFPENFSV